MEMLIERASDHGQAQPCDGAYSKELDLISVDIRNCSMDDARKRDWFGDWLARGFDHNEVNGRVQRKIKYSKYYWLIEVDNVLDLAKKLDCDLIIQKMNYIEFPYMLIIYDDCVE